MMMQDSTGAPACSDDPAAVIRSGQSVFMSVYRTKFSDQCRLITVTWCKNLLLYGLSVSVEGLDGGNSYTCKVQQKPWCFWRKQGSKRIVVDSNKPVDIFWDVKAAKFNGETEPSSEYYVAVIFNEEVVLLLGDMKKDAYKKTGCRPALNDPILVSRKEHVFGKKKFATRVKFHEKGRFHDISIECKNRSQNNGSIDNNNILNGFDPEMEIRIDGHLVLLVKHLQWKFRGNEHIHLNRLRVEVYWDVHNWFFSPGLRHALFIFKPTLLLSSSHSSVSMTTSSSPFSSSSSPTPLSSNTGCSGSIEGVNGSESYEFCLFFYAWKVE